MKVDRKRRKKKREMSVAYKSMLERIVIVGNARVHVNWPRGVHSVNEREQYT